MNNKKSETKKGYMNKSITNSWKTPPTLYKKLQKRYKFSNFDPCPFDENWKKGDKDGRDLEWNVSTFVNPPYSQLKSKKGQIGWIEKAHIECQKGKEIYILIPARTDTTWFHDIILKNNYRVKFIKGRVKFVNDKFEKMAAPFPSMIVIMKKYKTNSNLSLVI